MPRKVVMPSQTSRAIGKLRIARSLKVSLLAAIYAELPILSKNARSFRNPLDERLFFHSIRIEEDGQRNLFVLTIDDATAADSFFVEGVMHAVLDELT